MKPSDLASRFDELDAARALGDLSPEERAEWQQLVDDHGFQPDTGLDLLVAGLESTLPEATARPPARLVAKLEQETKAFMPASETVPPAESVESNADIISFWKHPALGWAAAACFGILLYTSEPSAPDEVDPAQARNALLASASSVQLPFAGLADYEGLSGDVVWADDSQSGYMRFEGLPANDPTVAQYQLWIVDPERDERPVDGGVFDIPAGEGEVVVPIRAALAVSEPVAFVITVEKPGGVVVSSQEIVAAIAQRG